MVLQRLQQLLQFIFPFLCYSISTTSVLSSSPTLASRTQCALHIPFSVFSSSLPANSQVLTSNSPLRPPPARSKAVPPLPFPGAMTALLHQSSPNMTATVLISAPAQIHKSLLYTPSSPTLVSAMLTLCKSLFLLRLGGLLVGRKFSTSLDPSTPIYLSTQDTAN